MGVRTFLTGIALTGLAAALTGCGGAGSGSGAADDEPTPSTSSCPSFAAVEDAPGADGVYQRFIVGLDARLQDDAGARAELLERVGEQLCLTVTETDPRLTRAVVVDVGRPLDAAGQARVVAAFEELDGVAYAEPDLVVTLDEPGLDGPGPDGGTAE